MWGEQVCMGCGCLFTCKCLWNAPSRSHKKLSSAEGQTTKREALFLQTLPKVFTSACWARASQTSFKDLLVPAPSGRGRNRHFLALKEERGPRAGSGAGTLLGGVGGGTGVPCQSGRQAPWACYLMQVLYERRRRRPDYPQTVPEWHGACSLHTASR